MYEYKNPREINGFLAPLSKTMESATSSRAKSRDFPPVINGKWREEHGGSETAAEEKSQ